MKLISLPDLHGSNRNLSSIAKELAAVDYVLLPGDLTNGNPLELTHILQAIRTYNPHILAVPGNMDMVPFPRQMAAEDVNIHAGHRMINDMAFLGVGGALPYYGTFVFDENRLSEFLNQTVHDLDGGIPKILLCHQPPYNTSLDVVQDGSHVGSQAVRRFIENVQPLVCFTGHIHEATGIDTIGDTQIINPGALPRRGAYAYAEIENGTLKTLEIRKV